MNILNGLINGLILVGAYVLTTVITGVIIALINRLFYKITGDGYNVCITTGFIGTPIHELGHAIFCVIFGHKITEIKLFQRDSGDGTLGYVCHSYNKRNPYQRMGNFFIGVGPIFFGSGVILLLLFLLNRSSFTALTAVMKFFVTQIPEDVSLYPNFIFGGISIFIEQFFSAGNVQLVTWWVFLILCMLISLHMTLSNADIHGALDGLVFTIVLLIIVPTIVSVFSYTAMSRMMGYLLGGAAYLSCVYMLAIILSFVSLAFALPIRLICKVFRKR